MKVNTASSLKASLVMLAVFVLMIAALPNCRWNERLGYNLSRLFYLGAFAVPIYWLSLGIVKYLKRERK